MLFVFLSGSYALDESQYFGARLIDFDAQMAHSEKKSMVLRLTSSLEVVGAIQIIRIKDRKSALECSRRFFAGLAGYQVISAPECDPANNSVVTFELASKSAEVKTRIYVRVMKIGVDCYFFRAQLDKSATEADYLEAKILVDSIKFN